MKKQPKTVSDFKSSALPRTRKEQFKDILKTRYLTLLSIGGVLLLFLIPALVIYGCKNYFILKIISGLQQDGADTHTQLYYNLNYTMLFDAIQIVGFGVFFIGLAGVSKVIRSLTYMEPIFFKEDFSQGVKENWKHYIVISLFLSFSLLFFHLIYNSGYYSEVTYLSFGAWGFIGLFAFIFGPTLLMSMSMTATYKNKFIDTFKSSLIISIRHYFPYVLFALILIIFGIGFYFMSLYLYFYINIAVVTVLTLYALPVLLLGNYLYCFYTFDEHINVNQKEIYHKGLYIEEIE